MDMDHLGIIDEHARAQLRLVKEIRHLRRENEFLRVAITNLLDSDNAAQRSESHQRMMDDA